MSLNKATAVAIVSALIAVSASPVYAKGYNAQRNGSSIVDLERDQIGNSASPSVRSASTRGGDESLVRLELQQIPGGSWF